MKIVSLYLPQFHTIPENDEWWGKGFTEWVNVKKAKPLFEGHCQPREPLNNNYYDLSNVEIMRWQSHIAKEHGLYGFCFYHYWFGGKLLLEKPVENFLKSDIDFNYCISWANEHWTNQWVSDRWDVFIEQRYGDKKEWEEHFNYLLDYFKDSRYIKLDGKPMFVVYKPELIEKRREMLDTWNKLAKKEGFPGMCFVFQRAESIMNDKKIDMSMFDYCAVYQPGLAVSQYNKERQHFLGLRRLKRSFFKFFENHFKFDSRSVVLTPQGVGPKKYNYDEVWTLVINSEDIFPKMIPSGFIDWDSTPRRERRGFVMAGASPEKFKKYLKQLINKARDKYETDLLFLFAWNEWAEGGYLEPDKLNGYGYLNAVKEALDETNENPYK